MSKITKSDLLNFIQEQADMLAELTKLVELNKRAIIKLENPQLKQLDQSIFDGLDEKWRFAVIQNNGFALICTKLPFVAFGGSSWDWNGYSDVVGKGYDASNWRNSLIERDIAKELLEVDFSSEMDGSSYYYSNFTSSLLEKGTKLVMCFVSNKSELDALNNKHIEVITSMDTCFNDSDGYGWQYAIPINNQGEPLTASVVGI